MFFSSSNDNDDYHYEEQNIHNLSDAPSSDRLVFTDPFQEIEDLKIKNQMLFDRISAFSEPPPDLCNDHYDFVEERRAKSEIPENNDSKKCHKKKLANQRNQTPSNNKKKSSSTEVSFFSTNPKNHSVLKFKALSFKDRWNSTFNPSPRPPPRPPLVRKAKEMQEKLENLKRQNEKLKRDYKSMLYKVSKTQTEVETLQDALEMSQIKRLVSPSYNWSVYSENAF